ncbi:MAG: hypothetical protein R3233_08835 [Xanthomonadales bacterium]|nr:hypothetical protein [Xanthomonadales bacterium]
MIRIALLVLLSVHALPLAAELSQAGDNGFTVTHRIETGAAPAEVYRIMTAAIDQWWNPDHSWSGQADNLHLRAEPGGCFCERLPDGGFVEHLRIIYLAPGREIRFDGALGPLQGMPVSGRMLWRIEAAESGAAVTFTYMVFGHPEGGLGGIAPAVDGVIGEQLQRLGARLAES